MQSMSIPHKCQCAFCDFDRKLMACVLTDTPVTSYDLAGIGPDDYVEPLVFCIMMDEFSTVMSDEFERPEWAQSYH